jgi:hypothetical protein
MDILAALKQEEKKLVSEQGQIATRLGGLRQAISALNGHLDGHLDGQPSGDRGSKLRGKKLSAAHRRAIKAGIARKKAFARKAGNGK